MIQRTRDVGHLYRIQPLYHGMDTGRTGDHRQVLMGLACPRLVAIFFDQQGNLLEVQQRPLLFMVQQIEHGQVINIYDERIGPGLAAWQNEIGFRRETIAVKKFFVLGNENPDQGSPWFREGIGIEDYPAPWFDILEHPDKYCEDERIVVNKEIPRWENEGQFVLWWGNDYWFDKKGECVAT